MSAKAIQQAIVNGILDEKVHGMLLKDLKSLTRQAGIPERFVWESVMDYCSADELACLATLNDPESENLGMIYLGKNIKGKSVTDRMMATAGFCLRNYINAKVMVLYDVLQALRVGEMPSPTVLLIPDFYTGGPLAEWAKSGLLGMLMKRQQESKKTIVYVSKMKAMESAYGYPFVSQIHGKFVPIT